MPVFAPGNFGTVAAAAAAVRKKRFA